MILKFGSKGEAVENLQSDLKALGYKPGPIDSDFGTLTRDAVRKFQKANRLVVSGKADEKTLALIAKKLPKKPASAPKPTPVLGVLSDESLRAELVALWRADVGQKETHGKNRSPLIDDINRNIKSGLGQPYCIAGLLIRGVKVICEKYGLVNPVTMTAGTQNFFNSAPAEFIRKKGTPARMADIGILVQKSDKFHGHAYALTEDEANKVQKTVEYNTDGAGSRDGDGVWQSKRTQSGTKTKTYRGSVDVVAWIQSANQLSIKEAA